MRGLGRLLLALCLFGLSQAYCPAFIEQERACTCFSYIDGAVIKCVGLEGPAVVEKLKNVYTEIRELSIQDANIIEIGPRAFRNLRVKSLILDNNKINKIHPDAFRGLEEHLQKLSISYNKLTEVPTDSLSNLTGLTVLNLQCNNIGDIYGSIFRGVSNLIELNLACNQICKISGPAFEAVKDNLQSLILDQNCLKEIPAEALRNFKSLLALHLQYNAIENIEKLELMNLVSLLMIRLTGNRIRNIDRYGLTNVPNLRYLYLNQNQLTNIEPNVLQQFKYLEIVDLSYNNIVEITGDSFNSLEHLMQLNLEGNSIRDIAPQAFANTPLLLLLLSKNCLSSINQQMFQGIPFLRQLSLADNNIRVMQPLSFSQLASLHMLDISRNKLQVIQPGALTASPHVTVLLQDNPVVCTQQGFHIVQGGQPIHLLNEKNAVCQTDYTNDASDICPTKKRQPEIPICCQRNRTTVVVPALIKTAQKPVASTSIEEELAFTDEEPAEVEAAEIAELPVLQPSQPEAPLQPASVAQPAVQRPAELKPAVRAGQREQPVVPIVLQEEVIQPAVVVEATEAPIVQTTPIPTTQAPTEAPTTTAAAPRSRLRGRDRLRRINFDRFLHLSGGRAPSSNEQRQPRGDRFNARAAVLRSKQARLRAAAGSNNELSGRAVVNRPQRGPQVPVIPRVHTSVNRGVAQNPRSQSPVVINSGSVVPTGFVDTRLSASHADNRDGGEVIQEGGRGDFQPNSGLPMGSGSSGAQIESLPPWITEPTDDSGFNIQGTGVGAAEQAQEAPGPARVRTLPKSQVSLTGNSQSQTPQKFV